MLFASLNSEEIPISVVSFDFHVSIRDPLEFQMKLDVLVLLYS